MPRIDLDALEDEWEEEELRPRPTRALSQKAQERIEQLESARVVAVDRGRVTVLLGDRRVEATLAGTMRGTKTAVGDEVRVRPARHESDRPRIMEVLERRSALRRTADDEADEERVVVANVDRVLVVVGADNLEAGARFADRVLVAASVGGCTGEICVNKIDLARRGETAEAVAHLEARFADAGAPVHRASALEGEGIDELRAHLAGGWSALAGHSGVGKSALLNRLVPGAEHAVGELGARGGRHTTTAARALALPDGDGWLVDTPGVRSFGLGALAPQDLAGHFPELAGLDCELDDCVHEHEPGCALDPDAVHPQRLASYRRLLAALRDH